MSKGKNSNPDRGKKRLTGDIGVAQEDDDVFEAPRSHVPRYGAAVFFTMQ